jgi:putative transposase
MARPLRIEFPGGLYHVTSRGDRHEAIYLSDADRQYWLDLLGQVCTRHNWLCHAYCLMDNNFYIVVETIDGNLSAGMRQLNGVYTQWQNRTHNRVGQVFRADSKPSSCSAKRTCWSWHATWSSTRCVQISATCPKTGREAATAPC